LPGHTGVSRRDFVCASGGYRKPTAADTSGFGSKARLERTADNIGCSERVVIHASISPAGTMLFRCVMPLVCNASSGEAHSDHHAVSSVLPGAPSAVSHMHMATDAALSRAPFLPTLAYQSMLSQVASGHVSAAQAKKYASSMYGPISPSQGVILVL
jgi:hypothetical protein